jgi:kynurenine formamidase
MMTERVTNWGRWGREDELGALNLLTDDRRKEAAAGVRSGRVHSLAYPLGKDEAPHTVSRHPVWHTTTITRKRNGIGIADDVLTMHSHIGTHMDALCHYWGDDGLYNGFAEQEIVSHGAPHLSIERVSSIVGAAVMLDVSAQCPEGRDAFGWEVTPEHITAELDRAGLTIEAGDSVLLYTGWGRKFKSDPDVYNWGEPGIGLSAARWLAERDTVLVGADSFAVEAIPPAVRGKGLPVHQLLLNQCGIYILENLDMSAAIAAEGSVRGMFVLAPLRITGGCGSPVNPLLIL